MPSLPFLLATPEIVRPETKTFGRPRIPNARFEDTLTDWLTRIVWSSIASIKPAPNTGLGIRKITLPRSSSLSKFGWARLHPSAPSRPVIVNRLVTPPSGVPSGFLTNLASRTGPFSLMKEGTASVPPNLLAKSTWGFTAGLVPPIAGCAWQPPQPSRFILGPKPSGTSSSSSKSSCPRLKNSVSRAVNPAMGCPAPGGSPRTPGSRLPPRCESIFTWNATM